MASTPSQESRNLASQHRPLKARWETEAICSSVTFGSESFPFQQARIRSVPLIFILTHQFFGPQPNSDRPQCDCTEHEEEQQFWYDRDARSSNARNGSAT